MISLSNLGKSFGAQRLFAGVSFQLNAPNRYGLVGANGSGKSTLLRMLIGADGPSEGTISMPRKMRLGVLEQDHFQFEDTPILDVVMMGRKDLWSAMVEKEAILEQADTHFDSDRYAELEDIILSHDGYAFESRAGEILEGLGIATARHRDDLSTLSGGFKLRVLLARVLAAEPDCLLLDEPTNHLDILSIRWLEKFLVDYSGLTMVISHDHRFLDNVCNNILDVDYETIILYPGNYQAFVEAKRLERERKEAEIDKREKQIADHKAFIDRFKAKATKARQAQSKMKKMEKIQIESLAPSSRRYPLFRFESCRPSGKKVLKIKGLSKSFDENQVLDDIDFQVDRGDRVAIIGPNGIGKSTLLKILVGDLEADQGEVEWGYETHPGYFAQDHKEVFGDLKTNVESWLWEVAPGESIGFIRGRLGWVLFSGDEAKKKVASISGGEAARLVFARLGIEQPNVLLLDEPTNHLDLEAIDALVTGLEDYDGTILLVSHDRWFVSRLANRIVEISEQGINDYRGSYEEYVERCGDDHLDTEKALLRAKKDRSKKNKKQPKERASNGAGKKNRRSMELRRDELTREIESAEEQVAEINERFCDPGFFQQTDPKKIRRLEQQQQRHNKTIERLMEEWQEIEEELAAATSSS